MYKTGEAENGGPLLAIERQIMEQIRSVCSAIMPPDFSRLYLADSLLQLCVDFENRTGIRCGASIPEHLNLADLAPEKQLHCYRIVQEALTNVEKHSGAAEAVLSVRETRRSFRGGAAAKALLVCVSDDGAGYDGPGGRGLGQRSMYERTAILGGTLEFLSEAGQGLRVRLEFPIGSTA
jgi:signal transduction histidine kinase